MRDARRNAQVLFVASPLVVGADQLGNPCLQVAPKHMRRTYVREEHGELLHGGGVA